MSDTLISIAKKVSFRSLNSEAFFKKGFKKEPLETFIKIVLKKDKYGFYSSYDALQVNHADVFGDTLYLNKDNWYLFYRKFLKIKITGYGSVVGSYAQKESFCTYVPWNTHFLGDFSIFILPNGRIIDVRKLFLFSTFKDSSYGHKFDFKTPLKNRLTLNSKILDYPFRYIESYFEDVSNCIVFIYNDDVFLKVKLDEDWWIERF